MNIRNLFFLVTMLLALSCNNPTTDNNNCGQNAEADKLLVFVGEKIEVKEMLDEKNIMDAKFLAKYKIVEKICGDYKKDTIEFLVYDHYGRPKFEKFKNVLLYVSEEKGIYYHEKYVYNDLYPTKQNKWASPYSTWDYDAKDTSSNTIKPEKIEFLDEVFFDLTGLKKREIKERYPEPFYRSDGNKAVAVYGNYVPELFELKKTGVFTARGIFGNKDEAPEKKPKQIQFVEDVKISKAETRDIIKTWKKFFNSLETKNDQLIKDLSFDSVVCSVCEGFSSPYFYNDSEPIDTFISNSYKNFPNTPLWKMMMTGKHKIYAITYTGIDNLSIGTHEVLYRIEFSTKSQINKAIYYQNHFFEFIKIDGNFKFTGMESSSPATEYLDD